MSSLQKITLERIIFNFGKLLIIPIFLGLIAFTIMLIDGCLNIYQSIHSLLSLLTSSYSEHIDKKVMGYSMSAIDEFLIATVFFIFSFGIFKIFFTNTSEQKHQVTVLEVNSLDDLKDKLGKTIVLAMIIDYFKLSLELNYNTTMSLLLFAGGVLIIAIALFFTKNLMLNSNH